MLYIDTSLLQVINAVSFYISVLRKRSISVTWAPLAQRLPICDFLQAAFRAAVQACWRDLPVMQSKHCGDYGLSVFISAVWCTAGNIVNVNRMNGNSHSLFLSPFIILIFSWGAILWLESSHRKESLFPGVVVNGFSRMSTASFRFKNAAKATAPRFLYSTVCPWKFGWTQ